MGDRLKIVYIHQHYVDARTAGGGTRSWEWARRLAKRGHRVEIWTGTGARRTEQVVLEDCEFDVRSWGISYANRQDSLRRIFAFARFTVCATARILFRSKPDMIIATSTPLTVAIPAIVGKKVRAIPYLFEVRDQWPAVPIEMGLLPKIPLLKRLALWLEMAAYRHAGGVVALSPGMASGVKGVIGPTTKIDLTIVPNASDVELFDNCAQALRQQPKSESDQFTILYTGTLGAANDVGFIVELIHALDRKAMQEGSGAGYRFVVVGEGKERHLLEAVVCQLRCVILELVDPVPKHEIASLYAEADLALVTFAPFQILEHNSANKFFDALASGTAVALNYGGWQRTLIEEANAGLWLDRSEPEKAANDLANYCQEGRTAGGGINARQLGEQRFDRDALFAVWLAAVERASGQPSSSSLRV